MVARYNVYYHGQKILNESVEDLIALHKDDFSKPIEVYPYGDEAAASGLKPKMEEVMKKTSTIISRRSRSKWVDDCYLLMGKSHFFKGDLYAADESFQFVNAQYNDQPIHYDAKLWILKTLVRQNKITEAEAIFKIFQRDEVFPKHLQDELNCVAGDIFTKLGLYPEAQKFLELGLAGTKDKVIQYRIHFLLAQLYLATKDYDKARQHFRKVVKTNAPYEFAFQSNIGIVKANSLSGKTDTRESRRNLKRMLKDDKNIDYYDQLYFELGNLDYSDGNMSKAVKNYLAAAGKASKNPELKTNAYLAVAKIYYEGKNYRQAQKYFDSTAMFITEKHPDYEKIKLQQSVLTTLIDHLIIIATNDSLLQLSEMPKDKLDAEIRKIIAAENDAKKQAAKKAKAKEEEAAFDAQPVLNTNTPQFAGTDQFIFDNQSLLGKEYNEFVRRWGNRKLTDNWRITAIKKELTNEPESQKKDSSSTNTPPPDDKADVDNAPTDLKKYYAGIPFSKADKDLANKKILESHFEAGKIYNEKLKEYKEAINHFEAALNRYPKNNYEPDILYYLVKCYEALADASNAKIYKNKLAAAYPTSSFNQVLAPQDPNNPVVSNDNKEKREVMEYYQRMYRAYESGDYKLAKQIKQEADTKYAGNAIQVKFDYLYALCVAKTEGQAKYLEALKQIRDNYKGTEIGNQAEYTISIIENKEKVAKIDPNSIYKYDGGQSHYFCLVTNEGQSDRYKTALSNFNMKYFTDNAYKTKSFLLGNKDMVGVEVFTDKDAALEYYKSFVANFKEFVPDMEPDVNFFIISSENFKTLLKEMDATEYVVFFKKLYL
jgi:tetratricopeptide (TPR) repeat protein